MLNQFLLTEATEYEFKATVDEQRPRSWLKTVSAFANGIGGSIYFGVSNERVVLGLDNIDKVAEKVSELIKARIDPALRNIVLEPLQIEDKEILRLRVFGGANTPYYYVGDGNKDAYYRLGNESVKAPATILNELVLKGMHQTVDCLRTEYRFSNYSYTLFEATYLQKTGNYIEKPRDYYSFDMLTSDDLLTFVGALFADQCPIYQSRVFCTRWNGLKKGGLYIDALDTAEYSSNLISLLNDTMMFIRHNSSVKWKKTGSGRVELPDYPTEAVHEALVNAIVHRDYMIKGSEIHVDMYDDRLEIVSPGGMPDGKFIQYLNIKHIASLRRNPLICDIFSRLKLMERRGSGLHKILDGYPEDNAPTFISTEQSFIVILKNLNYNQTPDVGTDDLDDGMGVLDVGSDNGTDVLDVGTDVPDVGTDNGIDVHDNGIDIGIDVPDVGIDVPDSGIDTGTDVIDNGIDNDTDVIDNVIDNGLYTHTKNILNAIRSNPNITQKEIALKMNLSSRTVARAIKRLRETKVIRRVGSDRLGYWEII